MRYFVFYLWLCPLFFLAQSGEIDKVIKFDFANVKAFEENNEVKGYYFFYEIEKVNKKENLYGLQVYDQDLKPLSNKEIVGSNKMRLLSMKQSGATYCIQYFNAVEKRYDFTTYNEDLSEKGNFLLPIPKDHVETMVEQPQDAAALFTGVTHSIMSLPGERFAVYGSSFNNSAFELITFSNSGEELWRTGVGNLQEGKRHMAGIVGVNEKFVAISGMYLKGRQSFIRFVNIDDGEELALYPIEAPKYFVSLEEIHPVNDGYIVTGSFVDRKNYADNGIVLFRLSRDYKIQLEKYSYLKEEVMKKIPSGKSNLFEGKSLMVHELLTTADAKLFVVGEWFDKKYLYEMTVIELDKDLNVIKVNLIEKNKSSIATYPGMFLSQEGVGGMAKIFEMTDYCYTSLSPDKKEFTGVYYTYDRESRGDFKIGTATFKNGGLKVNEVKLNTRPDEFKVLKAKPGKVVIFEYFEKDKKVKFHLENI